MDVYLKVTIGPRPGYQTVTEEVYDVDGGQEAIYAYADDPQCNNLVDAHTIAGTILDTMHPWHREDLWKVISVVPVSKEEVE